PPSPPPFPPTTPNKKYSPLNVSHNAIHKSLFSHPPLFCDSHTHTHTHTHTHLERFKCPHVHAHRHTHTHAHSQSAVWRDVWVAATPPQALWPMAWRGADVTGAVECEECGGTQAGVVLTQRLQGGGGLTPLSSLTIHTLTHTHARTHMRTHTHAHTRTHTHMRTHTHTRDAISTPITFPSACQA